MNILILNWRDFKNPASGGAEILTHEIAKRWVKNGHTVTLFSANYKGGKENEIIEGVQIIRKGRWWTVHVFAIFYYFVKFRKTTDVIIDEVHWFPFFSGVYAREKTVLLACEVAHRLFFALFPYPFAMIARGIEKIYLLTYRELPVLAISPSTKEDLIQEGINSLNITILPIGIKQSLYIKAYRKEKRPTVIFLGRVNKQKGIEDAIDAFVIVKKQFSEAVLWVVGLGKEDYLTQLKEKISNLGLRSSVKFFGFVSESEKYKLLSKAHVLVVPSIHEGWGLVVSEAGLVRTPAVVYNVSGLRDTVIDGKTGYVVDLGYIALAEGLTKIFQSNMQHKKMQHAAQKRSKVFNWDTTARIALEVLKRV